MSASDLVGCQGTVVHNAPTNSAPNVLTTLIRLRLRASPTPSERTRKTVSHLRSNGAASALRFEELLNGLLPAHAIPPPEKPRGPCRESGWLIIL